MYLFYNRFITNIDIGISLTNPTLVGPINNIKRSAYKLN